MKRRIQNSLSIICDDVDLETVSNIEFYVKQGRFFRQYVTEVISSNEMLVRIPFEDAKVMTTAPVQLQSWRQRLSRATTLFSFQAQAHFAQAGGKSAEGIKAAVDKVMAE